MTSIAIQRLRRACITRLLSLAVKDNANRRVPLAPDRLYDRLSSPRLMYPEYSQSMDCVKSNVVVCHLSPLMVYGGSYRTRTIGS